MFGCGTKYRIMTLQVRIAGRILAWLMAAAVCGCIEAPRNGYGSSGSLLYTGDGSGSLVYAGGGEVGGFHRAPKWRGREYCRGNAALDAAYQRLSTHMDLRQQLALSREQTIWLNKEQAACAPAGIVDYHCEA